MDFNRVDFGKRIKEERVCYSAEIDPKYADVIVKRYMEFRKYIALKKRQRGF